MEIKKIRVIMTFIVRLLCALGILALGIIILLNSNKFGEGTTATLITMIVGALGVSLGYVAKADKGEENK